MLTIMDPFRTDRGLRMRKEQEFPVYLFHQGQAASTYELLGATRGLRRVMRASFSGFLLLMRSRFSYMGILMTGFGTIIL